MYNINICHVMLQQERKNNACLKYHCWSMKSFLHLEKQTKSTQTVSTYFWPYSILIVHVWPDIIQNMSQKLFENSILLYLFFMLVAQTAALDLKNEPLILSSANVSKKKLLMRHFKLFPPVLFFFLPPLGWHPQVSDHLHLLRSSVQCGRGFSPPRSLLLPPKQIPLGGGGSGSWGDVDGRPRPDLPLLLLRPPLSPPHLLLFPNTPALLAAAPPVR